MINITFIVTYKIMTAVAVYIITQKWFTNKVEYLLLKDKFIW